MINKDYLQSLYIDIIESQKTIATNVALIKPLFAEAYAKVKREVSNETSYDVVQYIARMTGLSASRFASLKNLSIDTMPTQDEIDTLILLLDVPTYEYYKQEWPLKFKARKEA